jgi:hypothetical protein
MVLYFACTLDAGKVFQGRSAAGRCSAQKIRLRVITTLQPSCEHRFGSGRRAACQAA